MADESEAAARLGLNWTVWLCQGRELAPLLASSPRPLKYAALRIRFYWRLVRLARRGHRIVLRHSAGDPFLFLASFLFGTYFTVHHTLEEEELAASPFPYARLQLVVERLLGRRVIARARGIICVTPEIARHQLDRVSPRPDRAVFEYPNGICYSDKAAGAVDLRGSRPELIFVASYFYDWHGLEQLLESMSVCAEDGVLHLVGALPERLLRMAQAEPRVKVHGPLEPPELDLLVTRCWAGLSSFGLTGKSMTEACTLKVREYLKAGLVVYAGHRDSALPPDFAYFREGLARWSSILSYARSMRTTQRDIVVRAARPFIDKAVLLERLHCSLEELNGTQDAVRRATA